MYTKYLYAKPILPTQRRASLGLRHLATWVAIKEFSKTVVGYEYKNFKHFKHYGTLSKHSSDHRKNSGG
jgi:hypothetical protein